MSGSPIRDFGDDSFEEIMLLEEIKAIKSTKKELRDFGVLFGAVSAVLGGVALWKGRGSYVVFLPLSVLFFTAGVFFPLLLKPLQKTWMTAALLMGSVMASVILAAVFYFVIFPIGLLSRLGGRDFLDRKLEPQRESYWTKRADLADKTRYEKQF